MQKHTEIGMWKIELSALDGGGLPVVLKVDNLVPIGKTELQFKCSCNSSAVQSCKGTRKNIPGCGEEIAAWSFVLRSARRGF